MKTYNLFLPVFKQGDDLAHHLEANNGHPVKSFLDLAEQYKSAAEICQTVATVLSRADNVDDVQVDAGTHCIFVNAPEEAVSSLVRDSILVEEDYSDEEE
jgi:hypothetical protein